MNSVDKSKTAFCHLVGYHLNIFKSQHTIQVSFESGHRISTDNVTEICRDNATFT